MKTVLYLIQAASGLPDIYSCLRKRSFLLLSYSEKHQDTTIYAPNTTWTQGRNLLYEHVKKHQLKYDYYVFMDEDLLFIKRSSFFEYLLRFPFYLFINRVSKRLREKQIPEIIKMQEDCFQDLENNLELGYQIVCISGGMFTKKRLLNDQLSHKDLPEILYAHALPKKGWQLQTVAIFDANINAISKEAFFADTILPYNEEYDSYSWWLSQFIFLIKTNFYYRNLILQDNKYCALNTQSKEYPRMAYNQGGIRAKIYHDLCQQYGTSNIQFTTEGEIKADLLAHNYSLVLKCLFLKEMLYAITLAPIRLFQPTSKSRHALRQIVKEKLLRYGIIKLKYYE